MDFEALHASTEAVEDVAEAYLLRRLSAADLRQYEEHLLVCAECRDAVETTDEFIALFRAAMNEPQSGTGPHLV